MVGCHWNVRYSISGAKLLEFHSGNLSAIIRDDSLRDPKLCKQPSEVLDCGEGCCRRHGKLRATLSEHL